MLGWRRGTTWEMDCGSLVWIEEELYKTRGPRSTRLELCEVARRRQRGRLACDQVENTHILGLYVMASWPWHEGASLTEYIRTGKTPRELEAAAVQQKGDEHPRRNN